jgi:2-polyprenyl-6-methoxyphenol hydroxylase-like FAD-dependent oxidoreductase
MQQLQLSLHERQREFEKRAFTAFEVERRERAAQYEAMMKAIKDGFSSSSSPAATAVQKQKKRGDYLTELKADLKEDPNKPRFRV